MKFSYLLVLAALLLAAEAAWTAAAPAPKVVPPLATFTGSVADEAKADDMPVLLTDVFSLRDLWKAWGIADKMPVVDFGKQLVVQTTSRGGVLTMRLTLDDAGNLRVQGESTKDLRPGFRYVVAVVSRDGVKTVNGVPVPLKRLLAPLAEYTGAVAEASLATGAPAFITDAETFGKLWAHWQIADKQPEIDFRTRFVAVSTTVGSHITPNFLLDNAGNLESLGMATMDIRPGFRYIVSVLSRDGIKSLAGKPLPPAAHER